MTTPNSHASITVAAVDREPRAASVAGACEHLEITRVRGEPGVGKTFPPGDVLGRLSEFSVTWLEADNGPMFARGDRRHDAGEEALNRS